MRYLLQSLFVLLLAISFLVGATYLLRSFTFPDSKGKIDCASRQDIKNGKCTIFEDDMCWKGKCDSTPCKYGSTCTKNSHPGPYILMIASFVFFITSIVLFVLNFTSHPKEIVVHHGYGSSCSSSG